MVIIYHIKVLSRPIATLKEIAKRKNGTVLCVEIIVFILVCGGNFAGIALSISSLNPSNFDPGVIPIHRKVIINKPLLHSLPMEF